MRSRSMWANEPLASSHPPPLSSRTHERHPPAGLVISMYVTRMAPLEEPKRLEMIRYLCNRADPDLGGWGMSVASPFPSFLLAAGT